jgi:carbonic anhydrase
MGELKVKGLKSNEELIYELVNIHFHELSEHTIDDKYFSMEMHMVHSLKEGYKAHNGRDKLVLAVLFNYNEKSNSKHNP